MRKRFPTYALLAILLATCAAAALLHFIPLRPTRTELWMDLYSARMEFRYFFLGHEYKRTQPIDGWRNRLSQDYLRYVGPFPAEQEWVMLRVTDTLSKGSEPQPLEAVEFGQRGVSREIAHAGLVRYQMPYPFTTEAKRKYILEYLKLLRLTHDRELIYDYEVHITEILMNIDHDVRAEDIPDAESYLAKASQDSH